MTILKREKKNPFIIVYPIKPSTTTTKKEKKKKRGLGLSAGKLIVKCSSSGTKHSWGEGRRGYLPYTKNPLVTIILVAQC